MPALTSSRFGLAAYGWVAILTVVLVLLAAAVNAGALRLSDRVLLFVAQAPAGRELDWVMALVTLLGSIEVTGIAVVILVVANRRLAWRSWERWLPLGVFALVTAIEVAGKLVVHQPSPPLEFLRGPRMPGVGMDTGFSFPSGHMTRVALVLGLVTLRVVRRTRQPLWLWVCVGVVWVIGYSRVYRGEHWPADVAGGILLGGAGLALCLGLSPAGSIGEMGNLTGWPSSSSNPDFNPPGTSPRQ